MLKVLATINKELILLRRDRSGLLVLFVMPAILVLVMTLVQENALKTIGEGESQILFINKDKGDIGQQLEALLAASDGVTLIKTLDGAIPNRQAAINAVSLGAFQLCLIVPEGLTAAVKTQAEASVRASLSMPSTQQGIAPAPINIELYFDPTVLGGFRSAIQHLFKRVLLGIEIDEKIKALSRLLPVKIEQGLENEMGGMAAQAAEAIAPKLQLAWDKTPIIAIEAQTARKEAFTQTPNAVQHNVPAWSLFGVFFIVLPMAGSFIKERLCGAQQRIMSLPVSYVTILAGKVSAYILVCLVQFGLILCIGKWVLPLFGSPAFDMGPTPMAVALVALSATLAATGYGILLGSVISSYEQAAMFGPISIVLAAAIGGIMVPIYAMPEFIQRLSIISPLAWGQNAFLKLFVRGGGLTTVAIEIAALLGFALVCTGVSWWWFSNRCLQGK